VLINPKSAFGESQEKDLQATAPQLGRPIFILHVSSERDIDSAFPMLIERRAKALLVTSDPFFNSRREQLVIGVDKHLR
jgi:putative ABC transport system substrate-binding protein